jgi:hypothetical protein
LGGRVKTILKTNTGKKEGQTEKQQTNSVYPLLEGSEPFFIGPAMKQPNDYMISKALVQPYAICVNHLT